MISFICRRLSTHGHPLAFVRDVPSRQSTVTEDSVNMLQRAKTASDTEWEATSMAERRAFVKQVSEKLKRGPSSLTEQQLRRYYETTARNPLKDSEKFSETISDAQEQVRLGLPQVLVSPRRLGVTDAIYHGVHQPLSTQDDEPMNDAAEQVERATLYVKQLMMEHVRRRADGEATEPIRRELSQVSAKLNAQTQTLLARVFKRAERTLQDIVYEERMEQLRRLEVAKRKALEEREESTAATSSGEENTRMPQRMLKLDLAAARRLRQVTQSQRLTLRLCAVIGLFLGKPLTELNTINPSTLAELSPIQVLAAAASQKLTPVAWAEQWLTEGLRLPLESTQEFQEQRELEESIDQSENTVAAAKETTRVLKLAERMFVSPRDPRAKGIRSRRLFQLALQHQRAMAEQLSKFTYEYQDAAHNAPEAECIRALYYSQKGNEQQEISTDPKNLLQPLSLTSETAQAIIAEARSFLERFNRESTQNNETSPEQCVGSALQRRQRQLVERMLKLLERDAREDVQWVESLREAERPPPLPLPEPMAYVSAGDALTWPVESLEKNPFDKSRPIAGSLFGQPWRLPRSPLLFWGTGTAAVEQALRDAANKTELPPPYPCAENPWGWRLRDPLQEDNRNQAE